MFYLRTIKNFQYYQQLLAIYHFPWPNALNWLQVLRDSPNFLIVFHSIRLFRYFCLKCLFNHLKFIFLSLRYPFQWKFLFFVRTWYFLWFFVSFSLVPHSDIHIDRNFILINCCWLLSYHPTFSFIFISALVLLIWSGIFIEIESNVSLMLF